MEVCGDNITATPSTASSVCFIGGWGGGKIDQNGTAFDSGPAYHKIDTEFDKKFGW